jgi:hypothetical protein
LTSVGSLKKVLTLSRTLSKFPPLSPSTATVQPVSDTHIVKVIQLPVVDPSTDFNRTTSLNSYSAKLTGGVLDAVLTDPNVAYVREDATISINFESTDSPTTDPAPRDLLATDGAVYLGQGIDIYVLGENCPYDGRPYSHPFWFDSRAVQCNLTVLRYKVFG